jgi:hypothetical protein
MAIFEHTFACPLLIRLHFWCQSYHVPVGGKSKTLLSGNPSDHLVRSFPSVRVKLSSLIFNYKSVATRPSCAAKNFFWGAYREIFILVLSFRTKRVHKATNKLWRNILQRGFHFFAWNCSTQIFPPSNDLISIKLHLVAKHHSLIKSIVQQ